MKNNKRNGISLIVLVITIIVIIILAGAVILSLANNNPISQASKATYLSDLKNFQTELDLYETKQFADKLGVYNTNLLQADAGSVTYDGVIDTTRTINDLMPTLGKTTKYAGQFEVVDGKLVFQGSDTNKQDWAREAGTIVVIAGEPRVTIISPSETEVLPGTDLIYTIKFSSTSAITTIDLTSKVEVLDNSDVPLSIQPVINIGTVSGTSSDTIRYVDVTIKTDTLVYGGYKLKIKSGSVTNLDGISNTQDKVSLIGFDLLDNIPPVNPSMSASPTGWTNGNVTVVITYSEDSVVKEYSLDGTTWNVYSASVVVTENNKTVYAKGSDSSGNESGVATLTVSNIDKTLPTITASNGGSTTSSVIVTAEASDVGGSGLNTASYQYSKDNGTTWTTATSSTSYVFNGLITGTYQCKVRVVDNVLNSATSNAVAISTTALGTVTLTASPTGWTNGNVTVTITYPTEVVTKQYSTNGTTWNTYTSPVAVNTNNITVYAKGLDSAGNQTAQATLTISNIDTTKPIATWGTPSKTAIVNTESVTIPLTFTETGSGIKDSTVNATNVTIQKTGLTAATVTLTGSGNNWVATVTGLSLMGSFTLTATTGITDNMNNTLNSNVVSTSITVTNEFTTGTFTTAGATGRTGPSQTQLNSAYSGTGLQGMVTVSNGIQLWTVPYTGTYRIEAYGAKGGDITHSAYVPSYPGRGVKMQGDFNLTAGDTLKILVGQMGVTAISYGGGGGGTFVTKSDNTPLIIAGGGGGASTKNDGRVQYSDATTDTNGRASSNVSSPTAGAAGGLLTNGTCSYGPGTAFVNGGIGGLMVCVNGYSGYAGDGGFGGGGAGEYISSGGAGAGGGYSGGNSGTNGGGGINGSTGKPGGGGSYNIGLNQVNAVAANSTDGKVVITKIN